MTDSSIFTAASWAILAMLLGYVAGYCHGVFNRGS